jgi:tetratricopeptide (TPR) repeat protein
MDETQWDQIPIMVSKSQFNLQHYDEVYNSYYPENTKKYSSDDLFMFAKSSIAVGDVNTAVDITGKMKKDTDAYYESLYLVANFYKKNNDLNLSAQYYTKILEGGAPAHRTDKVRVELSDIYYRNKQYNDAIATLAKVSEGEFSGSKNSLLALSLFKTGDTEKALNLSLAKIQSISGSPYGEEVVKMNVDHYYGAHNLQKFGLFSDYLKQYKGKTDYVNYLSGKFYYEIRYYQNSLNYLYRLSGTDTQYGDEVNYYIGKIILFVYKNNNMALKYFQKSAMSVNNESVFKWKSKINIALIDAEMEDMEAAKMQLKDIIDNVQRGPTLNQAVNIKEFYGL